MATMAISASGIAQRVRGGLGGASDGMSPMVRAVGVSVGRSSDGAAVLSGSADSSASASRCNRRA
jgi:hypothetical protein